MASQMGFILIVADTAVPWMQNTVNSLAKIIPLMENI